MSQVAGKQVVGQRDNQEDTFSIHFQDKNNPSSDLLLLLSDGMGGHAGGEVASRLVCQVFGEYFISKAKATRPRARLKESLAVANQALAARIQAEPELRGMGCTLIATLKIGDRLVWLSVGDSILFLLRDGQLRRLNADHSLLGELMDMVRAGKMTLAEAHAHPKRNALRSAILGGEIALEDLNSIDLQRGDILLLASDGLETLSDAEIAEILTRFERPDMRAVASDLLNAVEGKAQPSQDNTTVVLYQHAGSGHSTSRGWTTYRTDEEYRSGPRLGLLIGLGAAFVALLIVIVFLALRPSPVPEVVTPPVLPIVPDGIVAPNPPEERALEDGPTEGNRPPEAEGTQPEGGDATPPQDGLIPLPPETAPDGDLTITPPAAPDDGITPEPLPQY